MDVPVALVDKRMHAVSLWPQVSPQPLDTAAIGRLKIEDIHLMIKLLNRVLQLI